MRVFSKIKGGFKRDGTIMLQHGENDLAEPLIATERAFIEAMVQAKLVTILIPEAPVSETKIATATPVAETPKTPMRVRRAKGAR